MGRDIVSPGTVEEKLNPWMQPIYDASICWPMATPGLRRTRRGYEESDRFASNRDEYPRRSLPKPFIVVDEAQNLSPLEGQTVMTRVGHGTKIVLTASSTD
jgi:PhoH-like ATPase